MNGFIETEIGKFPIGWEIKRLDTLFTIQQGKQVSKKIGFDKMTQPQVIVNDIRLPHFMCYKSMIP